jgi:hypothetical protein
MMKPTSAKVHWDDQRSHWIVEIQFGAEVVKRPIPKPSTRETSPAEMEELKSQAVTIGRDEGYDVDPSQIVMQT